jgi:peptidoglycan/xylan/chitin deacetylase (PgdA/CDA1 family)
MNAIFTKAVAKVLSTNHSQILTGLSLALCCSVLASSTAFAQPPAASVPPPAKVPRPPQFVMLAFDGSYAHEMWENSRQFAKEMIAQNKPLHFTYFISSVYYIGHGVNRNFYTPESQNAGSSAIGWGDDSKGLLGRYDETNMAHQEGHEIGSHAAGHFDGGKWSLAGWRREFVAFNDMITGFFTLNDLKPTPQFPNGWTFKQSDIVGFRAPQLGWNKDMWTVLAENHFRYDTSQTNTTNYWPEKNATGHHWNFPLGEVVIAGTGKRTLSMDYNFYYAQSNAQPQPAQAAVFEKQMYDTYMNYFQSNYNGNRAPVNIGHHFSMWNGGAYWSAMKHFAESVCGLPEVKCVTYKELANFMDSAPPETVRAYRAGAFDRLAPLRLASAETRAFDVGMKMNLSDDGSLEPKIVGPDAQALRQLGPLEVQYLINDQVVSKRDFNMENVRNQFALNSSDNRKAPTVGTRIMARGREILRQTHRVLKLGRGREQISTNIEEDYALKGDLPGAHTDESGNGND